MLYFPICKINLGLSVLVKRKDGFHNLETVMYPIELNDVLDIIVSSDRKFSFRSTGINIGGGEKQNLVIKAYNLLLNDYKLEPVEIHLHKIIPMGSGLGGGSSDAAYTIKLLNNIFKLKLSTFQKQDYARQLGSDCPFFIENTPVLASGKGDKFEKANVDLSNYHIVIVKPDVHVNTTEAYSLIKPENKSVSLHEIISLPVEKWKNNLINDFEEIIFLKHPEIKTIKNRFYELGAVYASMSGSGSAVYGIFKDRIKSDNEFPGCYVWSNRHF